MKNVAILLESLLLMCAFCRPVFHANARRQVVPVYLIVNCSQPVSREMQTHYMQERILETHVRVAAEIEVPLIIHMVDAFERYFIEPRPRINSRSPQA